MSDCPHCDRAFETEQGLRIHHTKAHGDPLPNRTCKGCNVDFYDPESRRSYCDDCGPNSGTNNGNWNGAKEETTCHRCGSNFEFYPSNKKGVYCPDCVDTADEFLGDAFRPKGQRVSTECKFCEMQMVVLQSRIENGNSRFCSRQCLAKWLSENVVGESHHQYREGETKYRGAWWRIRRKALSRDEHRCQNCGVEKEEIGREPDVHHLKPVRAFDEPQDAHELSNMISLCRSCHRLAESGTIEVASPEQ